MRLSAKLIPFAVLAASLCAGGACADDPPPPRLSFSGFGTLGMVHSSEGDADFTSTIFKPEGAGYSHAWSADVDSLLGGQAALRITTKLSAVVQVIAEQNYDGSHWPHVEWANIKYQFTPDLSVRVGRTVLPVFMVTDSRKIAYANPWVRPPIEVYSLVPILRNDGVDASYRRRVHSATNTFQVSAGRSDSKLSQGSTAGDSTVQSRWGVAVADTVERGFVTVRLNYGRTRLTIPELSPLFEGFRQFGPEGVAIAERYEPRKSSVTFFGIGGSYDPGKWFLMGEWGHVSIDSVFGVSDGWYASGGYRIRKALTAYGTYGQVKAHGNRSDPGLTVSALPPPLAGPATGLNLALNSLLSKKAVQNTVSIGGRWDFRKNAAFTLQLDHSRHDAGSAGLLTNPQPTFQPGRGVYVFTATVDFVVP
jgi:Gram-negative porin